MNAKLDAANAIKLSDEEAKVVDPEDQGGDVLENKKSKFNFMKGILPKYFDSEWSFARFKLPSDDNSMRSTCAFSQDGTHIIVVSSDGLYYLA